MTSEKEAPPFACPGRAEGFGRGTYSSGIANFTGVASALWLLMLGIHALLSVLNQNSSFNSAYLTLNSRLLLLSREALFLAPAAVCLAIIFLLFRGILSRTRKRLFRIALWISAVLISAGALFSYLGEWYNLLAMGACAGLDGIALLAGNPRQIFQHLAHMDPVVFAGGPLLAFAGGSLIPGFLCFVEQRSLRVKAALSFTAFLIGAGFFCFAAARGKNWPVRNDELLKKQGGIVATSRDLYLTLMNTQSGPLSRLVFDAGRFFDDEEKEEDIPTDLSAVWNRQIPVEKFVQENAASLKPYNVLFIVVESLRPDQLTAFGGSRPVMDTVDELARNGRIFTDNYTQASHSNYADICPLTSQYPLRSRGYYLYPEKTPYPKTLIYEILKEFGYRTAIISSQDENWGQMSNFLKTPALDHFFHAETFSGPTYVPRTDGGFAKFVKGEKRSGKIDDRYTVAEAVRWIGEDPEKPFFIYMNLQNSHVPYEIPGNFARRYSPPELDFVIRFGQFPKKKRDIVKAVYADSLAYVDSQLAGLAAFLRERKILERTIVVVTGDTGQAFFEHSFAGHANQVYDELMRVPLVITAPGLSAGEYAGPAQHIDVPPTVFALLGLPAHPAFQGGNLLADKVDPSRPRFLVAQTPLAHQYAIVQSGWKLIYDYRSKSRRLFNLSEDPDERRNIVKKEPERARELFGRLLFWKRQQLDYYGSLLRQREYYPPRYQ